MAEFLYRALIVGLVFWLVQALLLAIWGWRNGSRFWPSLLAGLLLGPVFGAVAVWWRGRLHLWRKRWRVHDGPTLVQRSGDGIYCRYQTTDIDCGLGARRQVSWQIPQGAAPPAGWPSVMLFQGTGHPGRLFFGAHRDAPFGGYYQTEATADLLEAGFAVIAPDALRGIAWLTNLPPYVKRWSLPGNPDTRVLERLFEQMRSGHFGPLDPNRQYAAGISSGGYMSSRVGVTYPRRYKALAVVAASYASCLGRYGSMPDKMPAEHPPTLFIHGRQDRTAPYARMLEYRKRLDHAGVATELLDDDAIGHAWLPGSGKAMVDWFNRYA